MWPLLTRSPTLSLVAFSLACLLTVARALVYSSAPCVLTRLSPSLIARPLSRPLASLLTRCSLSRPLASLPTCSLTCSLAHLFGARSPRLHLSTAVFAARKHTTQISPSISSGPMSEPGDSSISGTMTNRLRSQSDPYRPSAATHWPQLMERGCGEFCFVLFCLPCNSRCA